MYLSRNLLIVLVLNPGFDNQSLLVYVMTSETTVFIFRKTGVYLHYFVLTFPSTTSALSADTASILKGNSSKHSQGPQCTWRDRGNLYSRVAIQDCISASWTINLFSKCTI